MVGKFPIETFAPKIFTNLGLNTAEPLPKLLNCGDKK
jgi:hypothetical protein